MKTFPFSFYYMFPTILWPCKVYNLSGICGTKNYSTERCLWNYVQVREFLKFHTRALAVFAQKSSNNVTCREIHSVSIALLVIIFVFIYFSSFIKPLKHKQMLLFASYHLNTSKRSYLQVILLVVKLLGVYINSFHLSKIILHILQF